MKKVMLVIGAVCLLALGCTKGDQGQAVPAAPAKLRFAVIPKSLTIPVFQYARIGAEREAKILGNVEIIWDGPDIADPLKQKEKLESYIAQRVDGIAISCTNGEFLTPSINKAMDTGIPVVTWDSDAPKSKRIAFYGVNDFKSGQILGEELARILNHKGNIAIMTALGSDNLEQRLRGVMSVLKNEPGIKILNTFDCKDDPLVAREQVELMARKYTDMNGFITVGGWPVFNENGLDPIDASKVAVVSFDSTPPAPAVMKKGKVRLLVGQKYFGWGAEPVKMLYNIKTKNLYPNSPVIDSGVDVITPENLDAYLTKWRQMAAGQPEQ